MQTDKINRPVLVTGASGRTGSRVIASLLAINYPVRALVRRTEAGEQLLKTGVRDYVCCDLEDRAGLRKALAGCAQLVHICPPMHAAEDKIAGDLIAECRDANIERVVLYSVLHPAIHVPHHRRKLEAERQLIESGLAYTIVQPARYMQHLAGIWRDVVETGLHAMPFSTSSKFSLVDLADLADAVAKIVARRGDEGATYQLAGPEQLDQDQCAQIISDLLKHPVRAGRRSPEQALEFARTAGWPEQRIENLRIMNKHYDHHGLTGNANVLRWILGREPATFSQFVARDLLNT